MVKQLKPVKPSVITESELEKIILAEIYEALFVPILRAAELNNFKIKNSLNALRDAIFSSKIFYNGKGFVGQFSAAISKEIKKIGGNYNKRTGEWLVEKELLPLEIKHSIIIAENNNKNIEKNIIFSLDNLKSTVFLKEEGEIFSSIFYKNIEKINNNIDANISDAIAIKPQMSNEAKKILAKDYSQNLEKYVKDFIDKEILELREIVKDNSLQGFRADKLENIIKQRFGVSKRKAKFLAKQETSLLLSSFSKAKYEAAGITKYKWSTSHDSRVREDHKRLDGKIFYFNEPPISDLEKGTRANPSEDFGCRCVAIPIID